MELEARAIAGLVGSPDGQEGLHAFLTSVNLSSAVDRFTLKKANKVSLERDKCNA